MIKLLCMPVFLGLYKADCMGWGGGGHAQVYKAQLEHEELRPQHEHVRDTKVSYKCFKQTLFSR